MKLKEIAERLDCRLAGDGDVEITAVAGLEEAGPGELTFLSNPRYARLLRETKASAVIIANEVEDLPISFLVSDNPYLDFARALELFYQPPQPKTGIHPSAAIAASASIGRNAQYRPLRSHRRAGRHREQRRHPLACRHLSGRPNRR